MRRANRSVVTREWSGSDEETNDSLDPPLDFRCSLIHLIFRKSRNMKMLRETMIVRILTNWTSKANKANCTLIDENLD